MLVREGLATSVLWMWGRSRKTLGSAVLGRRGAWYGNQLSQLGVTCMILTALFLLPDLTLIRGHNLAFLFFIFCAYIY